MATYEFKCCSNLCPQDGELFDVRLPMAERDAACIRCPTCNSQAHRMVVPSSAPMVVMMKTGETRDKQIPERMLP